MEDEVHVRVKSYIIFTLPRTVRISKVILNFIAVLMINSHVFNNFKSITVSRGAGYIMYLSPIVQSAYITICLTVQVSRKRTVPLNLLK
jgi:hypothetical protein